MSVPIIDSSLNIKNANRIIALHSQITKISNKLVIENTGKRPVHGKHFAPIGTVAWLCRTVLASDFPCQAIVIVEANDFMYVTLPRIR